MYAYPPPLPLLVLGAALIIVAVIVALITRAKRRWLSHLQRKPLLTANEREFYFRLRRALPGYFVFPQVSFGALLTDDGKLSQQSRWAVRAKFDRKIADFVICERSGLKVVALIELDDRMHDSHADRQRDAITKAGGYQTFRFQSKQKPSEAELAGLFQHAQAW